MTTFKVFAKSFFVERDQRTRLVNLEGKLELQGKFQAGNNSPIFFPQGAEGSKANVQANQGETVGLDLELATVSFDGGSMTIPIAAEMFELEFGFGGNDDSGKATGTMVLDSQQSEISQSLVVNISADAVTERGGRVRVDFVARRQ
jgi:hypothetical protein